MADKLKESAQRVQNILLSMGYTNPVMELPDSTRTAKEAAAAIGCEVAQIAKSIVFRLQRSGRPLLVVASGVNRVNEARIADHVGDALGKADADFVREHTGYVIGGVPPIGHIQPIDTIVDEDLCQFETIWAAAGHPKAVFQLTPSELIAMTAGQVMRIN
ncbi:cys-tRNA(pro)/cys-tRNA(cys) deacylase [Alicyclobacillus contaminans]|uniref:YbaK/EbsC family protein n=1 Tax=Alicyclobacillus contaminans TaxID=392016 RepID=UPI000422076E|nr:YbaK/EbsC family protein [Alicyclobacillus contaminans]GMA49936.1 cys-tRNA(pro)/cys-tRNA(cys) deacylase [Alicyclobacillus contaminans]